MDYRVGLGYDIHKLADGGKLHLGGLVIDESRHLVGHSDGDVLLHAITDAILGALAAGDIGEHFPDNAAENKGRDSRDFLNHALALAQKSGWRVSNLDTNIITQVPRLSPHKQALRESIASLCGCPVDAVGVKAKTNEKLDAVGRSEAIVAQAVVMLSKQSHMATE